MTLKFGGNVCAELFQVSYVQMIKPIVENSYKNVDYENNGKEYIHNNVLKNKPQRSPGYRWSVGVMDSWSDDLRCMLWY
jgi:hypothetical protein